MGEWLAQYGESIYGTHGGPIAPQPWGVSTQTPETIYLHILDTSKANDDGWLTLSGTEDLKASGIAPIGEFDGFEARANDGGLVEVKVSKDVDAVDVVLAVKK
jgi:alpha-L-fucosidase